MSSSTPPMTHSLLSQVSYGQNWNVIIIQKLSFGFKYLVVNPIPNNPFVFNLSLLQEYQRPFWKQLVKLLKQNAKPLVRKHLRKESTPNAV